MPRFDRTGPEGKGPKTGRLLGKCGTSNLTQEEEQWNFFGRGRGYGRGRGFRFWGRRNQDDSGSSNSKDQFNELNLIRKNQMRKVAVPVKNGKLGCCFEQCRRFKIIEVKDHAIVNHSIIEAPFYESKALSEWILENRITDVIVGRIRNKFVKTCNLNKVNVFVGVQKEELNELVQDFIDGVLITNGDMVEHEF